MPAGARTHLSIDRRWSGEPISVDRGSALVRLATRPEMAADDRGLVHGGFVFSAADYAAMLAVNEPNVVLASSRMSFLAPVRVGEVLEAAARTRSTEGRSHEVEVVVGVVGTGASRAAPVATGVFRCVVTPTHVLDGRAVGPEER